MDIGLMIAIGSAAVSIIAWYTSQVKNAYSRDRELVSIARSLDALVSDLDAVGDRLSRLEVLLIRRGSRDEC